MDRANAKGDKKPGRGRLSPSNIGAKKPRARRAKRVKLDPDPWIGKSHTQNLLTGAIT